MDLLLVDFMKLDPSKNGKENVFSYDRCLLQILCSSCNTKSESKNSCKRVGLTNGFLLMEFQPIFIVIRVRALTTTIVQIIWYTTVYHHTLYPSGNSPCECLNCTLQNLLKTLLKDQKPNWPEHLSTLVFALV